MTIQYGAWVGGSTNGRIRCDHSVAYSADRTQAIYTGTLYLETDQSTSDSVNSWSVSGDDGAHSGSNLGISLGSGGGLKAFWNFSFQKYGDGSITGKVSNVEAFGGPDPTGTFTLNSGGLAPYFTDASYVASAITSTSATITGFTGNGNGGTLIDAQVEYNTAMSDTGALYYTRGTYGQVYMTGMKPNTVYYARIRIKNNTYGWSAWQGWTSFKTGAGTPGAPDPNWYLTAIGQTRATFMGLTCPNNGGSAITSWDFQYDTTQNVAATIYPTGDGVLWTGIPSGTTFWVRIRANNVNGVGVWSAWKTYTTQPGMAAKVGGLWKDAESWINVNGIWKPAIRYINVFGVWKQ